MEILKAAALGIIQGLTEFLPVSSSGHLVLAEKLLNFQQPGVLFDVIIHTGTTLAVVWYMRRKLLNIKMNEIKLIIVATIPAAIVGILFREQLESLFSLIKLAGFTFLISAFMNYQTDKYNGKRHDLDYLDAIVIGVFQAFAIIPAISRSGATIYAGSRMNLSKERAAEFSFLISIPAILGANLVQFISYGGSSEFSLPAGIVGLIAAFISGLFAINALMRFLKEGRLRIFAYYLVILGLVTIIFL